MDVALPRHTTRYAVILAAALAALALAVLASFALGTRQVAPADVLQAILHFDPANADHVVVREQRLTRTVVGLIAGAALGAAGTLMQGLTRNPLADPGLLGVNAGASLAVLTAITVFGITQATGFIWFAFAGAAIAAAAVYVIGSMGAQSGDPARLTLTGAAINAGLASVALLVLTTNSRALDSYRFWTVGSLTGRELSAAWQVLPFALVGLVIAALCGQRLNMLALGDEAAAALGHGVPLTRALTMAAAVLLCGSATALAGPVVFVGLVVPHVVRLLGVSDYRWLVAVSIPLGASLLLAADVIGRLIAQPGEVEAGVVVAVLGAPVLIAMVRRREVAL